jgi:hypothetical protein
MLEFVKRSDIFAQRVELNLAGKQGYQTLFGAFLSIIYVATIGFWTFSILASLFSTDNPTSFSDVATRTIYPKIDLGASEYLPIIIAYLGDTEAIDVESTKSYFSASSSQYSWTSTINNSLAVTSLEKKFFDVVPCKELSQKELAAYDYIEKGSYLREMIPLYGLCVKPTKDYFVSGKGSDELFQTVSLNIQPCITGLGHSCKPAADVAKVNFYILMPTTSTDLANLENPIKRITNADNIYYLNLGATQRYVAKIKENFVQDWRGFNPEWSNRTSFYDALEVTSTLVSRNSSKSSCTVLERDSEDPACETYFEYSFQSSGVRTIVRRKYKEYTEAVGDVGGVNEVLRAVFFLLYFYYNGLVRDAFLVNKVFSFFTEFENEYFRTRFGGSAKKNSERSFFRKIFCCCRKGSQEEIEFEENKKAALENIEANLDVLTIVREMNNLKVITNFLFKTRHFKLIPYMAFNTFRKRRLEKVEIANSKKSQNETVNPQVKPCNERHLRRFATRKIEGELTIENSAKLLTHQSAFEALIQESANLPEMCGRSKPLENQLDDHFLKEIKQNDDFASKLIPTHRGSIRFKTITEDLILPKNLESDFESKANSKLDRIDDESESKKDDEEEKEVQYGNLKPRTSNHLRPKTMVVTPVLSSEKVESVLLSPTSRRDERSKTPFQMKTFQIRGSQTMKKAEELNTRYDNLMKAVETRKHSGNNTNK